MRFSLLTRLITLSLALVVALAMPSAAGASGDDVIRDCAQDGDLDKEYSDEELKEAEENLPSDIDAYSGCRDVIRAAQAGGRGSADGENDGGGASAGGTAGGGSGGADPDAINGGATASDLDELNRRQQDAEQGIAPEVDSALPAGADAGGDDGLPTAALVAIALLGLGAVGGGVYLLRDYLPPGLSSRLPGASR